MSMVYETTHHERHKSVVPSGPTARGDNDSRDQVVLNLLLADDQKKRGICIVLEHLRTSQYAGG